MVWGCVSTKSAYDYVGNVRLSGNGRQTADTTVLKLAMSPKIYGGQVHVRYVTVL